MPKFPPIAEMGSVFSEKGCIPMSNGNSGRWRNWSSSVTGTPREIVDRLHAAGTKVLADPATQEGLKKLGIEPMPLTPGQMDDLVKREIAANFELIKAAGIKQ